ncbi:sensor histidine kinase [Polaribacter sp. R77954]|uniref:sensor histidine kinase n=1 Tax=Polaribacter sp. R77954 TaxID=3093870 RepID=UPI0037CC4B99
MLLKETHHRVKNSFQMVSSLLQLQAQGSEAEVAVTALNNAVQRVNSMIVLHQQLYAKDNLLGVDLKVYITELINEILGSYSSENINFKSKIVSSILDIDTATSIGLLVNELATNSIKYAWDSSTKEKNITLDINLKNKEFHFTMFDNGVSKKTATTKENYGSELIEILIERLEAEKLPFAKNDFGLNITFKKQHG